MKAPTFRAFYHSPMWVVGIAFDFTSLIINLGPLGVFIGWV